MVKLEFFDPSGALEAAKPHAPRLDSLAGKRIGFVSNEQWQAYRMLPLIKGMLEDDFPGIDAADAHRCAGGEVVRFGEGDRDLGRLGEEALLARGAGEAVDGEGDERDHGESEEDGFAARERLRHGTTPA